ncbi:hypothetical protein HPO96_32095 [Kribbella sandramycini]|uniref:Uncharacterized protein n=1 Tax=Kribbella sandramycini TaxID=60450 RepID=A0A7Y4L5S7_9ACTN|nr:hypothetical protein [Kribbella sandramycini]MBB6565898.1 hypothetical protein [Kribbella sandramycini]NOL44904.1 hypothetical protein [Kribbella sandramycini]
MPDKLKMNYNLLNDAKKDLEDLAGNIKPTLNDSLFSTLANSDSSDVLGSSSIYYAISSLHTNAQGTMTKAEDGLKKLAGSFGSVGEAFLQFDAEIAQGMNVTNSNLALSNWQRDKSQWDYYQAHKGECENLPAGTEAPDFCSATNPGDAPLDQTITTDRGNIQTHLTLDDQGNVIKEETTVTYDGKTYHSVTTYSDDKHTMITDSTYPDGSKVHDETKINGDGSSTSTATSTDAEGKKDVTVTNLAGDGSGTKTTTDSDGTVTEYTRGPDNDDGTAADWVEKPKPEDDYDYYPYPIGV